MTQCEVEVSASVGSCRWESSPGKQEVTVPLQDCDPQSPDVVRLSRKSSLVGAPIADVDEQLFLRSQSSMSSMISEKMRRSFGGLDHSPSPSKRSSVEQHPNESIVSVSSPASRNQSGMPPLHSPSPGKGRKINVSSPGSRNQSGLLVVPSESSDLVEARLDPQPSGHTLLPVNAVGCSRLPSGNLYPCTNVGNPNNSCLLNAAHFTFDNNTLATDVGSNNNNNLTERIFKKLMGQSRLHRSNSKSGGGDDSGTSPVSTLDGPKSPGNSERSIRGKSKRKSLRSRVEDANTVVAANPRPKSQLAQYLRSMTASAGDLATDEGTLEGPSEVAWLEPESPYHSDLADRSYASTPGGGHSKKKSTLESWSSSNSTWNLALVQNPLRTVSTMVSRRQNGSVRNASRLGESRKDAITRISLTGSYDGSYSGRSRGNAKKGTGSEVSSGRSWWSEFSSGRKSTSLWTCSGRLGMEVSAEPDLHEPDTAQAADNAARIRALQQVEGRSKIDEPAFPFIKPVASSFLCQEAAENSHTSTPYVVSRALAEQTTTALHKAAVPDPEGLRYNGDIYHDPEDGSVSDSEASPHWAPTRKPSFDYVREVAIGSSGLSSRALSRLLLIERTGMLEIGDGRFSVDLQRGQKLEKALHPARTPHVRIRMFTSDKSMKHRSMLSPCLPCLQKLPHNDKPPGIPAHATAAQAAAAPSGRWLQAMNSFAPRLGPVTDAPKLIAGPIYVQ